MERLPTLAGWIVGLLLLFALFSLIPETKCSDGWNSPSIGRQGACSHHGGVEGNGFLVLLAFTVSFIAGLFTKGYLSEFLEQQRKNKLKRSLVPPSPHAPMEEIIRYATLTESKIEFMYKGRHDLLPIQRIVTPTSVINFISSHGKSGGPYLFGHCHFRNAKRQFALARISQLKLHRPNVQSNN